MKKGLLFFLAFITCCADSGDIQKAQLQADELIKNLAANDSEKYFRNKYFQESKMNQVLFGIRTTCDYENRKGGFVDYFSQSGSNGRRVFFIYEFYLKCDSVRLILNYELEENPELVGFKVEPIEFKNPMIIDKSKQLDP